MEKRTFFLPLFITLSILALSSRAQLPSYPPLSARITGPANPYSPDPLVSYSWADPRALDNLESYPLRPQSWISSDPGSFEMADFEKKDIITVTGRGSLRLDFGKTSAGWLEFDSEDLEDSITMSISEYNEPAIVNDGALHPVKTLSPVRQGHTYRLVLNPEWYEGVRFGWIHVLAHLHTWHLKNLRLVCQVKPTNYQGSFSCSDTVLTRIWYTGAYTVKLNLQKDYFGAILMERSDRHSWTGDAYPSQAASMVAFGNYDFVKKNLENTALLDNGIASYSLYWVLSLIDYVNYTGDQEFARQYTGNAAKKLEAALQQFGKRPKLAFYGWDERLGAGFENPENDESQRAYSMLTIRTLFEFGRLLIQLGDSVSGNNYITEATRKIELVRKQQVWPSFGLHAAADAINTGLTTASEDSLFYKNNFTDRVRRLSYSPFNEYFIIAAMASLQKYDDAIGSIKDCWGGQLAYGGTTFFEDYRPGWNAILGRNDAPPNNQCGYTSLTHPWSAGVVKWLSEEVLGIKPVEPGFHAFVIEPHLGSSLHSVKGSVPTRYGLVSADINVWTGITEVRVPLGTIARRVVIPLGGNSIQSILLNGKPLRHMQLAEDGLILSNLAPGNYVCRIVYKNFKKLNPPEDKPWVYPIADFFQDSLTAGNWKKRYGKEGFVLFNYVKKDSSLQTLPSYLSALVIKQAANVHMEGQTFGALVTQDPKPTLQTMTIDIPVKDDAPHRLALYFLDWDDRGRRTAVEIFDLKTLELIAPVQLVKQYQRGKYLVFPYRGAIRIRINQVRGENAAVSGVFFDRP